MMTAIDLRLGWEWKNHRGWRMINKVASTFIVGRSLHCMANCTTSPICDSYNYRPSDKTCQLNTHATQHTVDSCVHTGSGLVLLTRRASSTHTTLHSSPTRPTSSLITHGPGGVRHFPLSSKQRNNVGITWQLKCTLIEHCVILMQRMHCVELLHLYGYRISSEVELLCK